MGTGTIFVGMGWAWGQFHRDGVVSSSPCQSLMLNASLGKHVIAVLSTPHVDRSQN